MPKPQTRTSGALASIALVASLLTSCVAPPLKVPTSTLPSHPQVGTLKLNLGDLSGTFRRTQWVPDSYQARLRIDGADLSNPVVMTVNVASTATASVTVTEVPVGTHRIITLERLDASGGVVPGGTLKTTADIVLNGTAIAPMNASTTPRGSVFEQLLAHDRSHAAQLAKGTDPAQVQSLVDQLLQQDALFPQLIDATAISASIIASGQVPAYSAAFAVPPAAVDVSLAGIPANAPADVWLDDPLSPKNVSLYGGTHHVSPIVPGTWVLHASSLDMGIESTMSVTLAPGQSATASLNLGAPPDQIKTPIALGIKAAATIPTLLDGREVMLMVGGLSRATDSTYTTSAFCSFDGSALTALPQALPVPFAYGQGAASGSSYFVAGGVADPGFPSLSRNVYQFSGATWKTLTLPAPRGGCSLAALQGEVYVIGGFKDPLGSYFLVNSSEYPLWISRTVYKYDGSSWTTLPASLNFARGDMAAVTVNNRIYTFGGMTYFGYDQMPVDYVESLDATSSAWRVEARMPTARFGAAAVVANGRVYVIGGNSTGGLPLGNVEVFDPVTGAWSVRPPLRKSRGYVSAAYLNGQIVVVGGGDGGGLGNEALPFATVEAFAP